MNIDFGQFVHALSDTVDLVGVDEIQHSKRVGFMALECAKLSGASEKQQQRLYQLGLLHDCGVSSSRVHKKLVDELDWSESHHHCQTGAERVEKFTPLASFAPPILYHHTRWEELQTLKLPDEVKQEANLIFLLDRVDALMAMRATENRLAIHKDVCEKICQFRGNYFDETLVELFLAAAEKEAFWITQHPQHLPIYLEHFCTRPSPLRLNLEQLSQMARIFAEVVDAKSPYTAEHSFGVTRLAGYLAERFTLSETDIIKIKVAGLLHDLGKLQVPDRLLEFQGGLHGENLAVMRHHSYVTYIILSRISGLEQVSAWAANHHEKLDGSGYPFRLKEGDLDIASRIIMVADIFQALAQDRPYRKPMSTDQILALLLDQAKEGKLDKEVVAVIEAELDICHQVATHSPSTHDLDDNAIN